MDAPSPALRAGRGRPRQHVDGAARSAAHRERVTDQLDTLHMLRMIFDNPTPALIERLSRRCIENRGAKGRDIAGAGVELIAALLAGLDAGGGANVSEAAANFVRNDYGRPGQ